MLLVAPPLSDKAALPVSPQGVASQAYSFAFSKVPKTPLAGGSVRVVDSTTFPISNTIAAAEVTVEPGAMRCVFFGIPVFDATAQTWST